MHSRQELKQIFLDPRSITHTHRHTHRGTHTEAQLNARGEARRQGVALGEYRQQLLLAACQRNIGTITAHKCPQWYRFMQAYLPR